MAKMTLIEIVTDIINDIDGDYIESINDTEESEQVAAIVRATYRSMMSNRNWPHTKRLLEITAASDSSKPVYMSIEDDLKELVLVNYDMAKEGSTRKYYQEVKYIDNDDFLRLCNNRNNTASNVDVIVDDSGVELLILNDKNPEYYTSFNDEDIVFDSYDSDINGTLVASKTQAVGYIIPSFELTDTHVPDLPDEAFAFLVEECKSKASLKLRQVADEKSEQEAGRQGRWLSRKSWRVAEKDSFPNYGRNRRRR
jgi:hypothetical protein